MLMRGVFSRGELERPSKVWRPRSGLRPHLGGQRPASLEHDPKEQPLLPGPGNNDNKALGRVQKTSRWSAERRGVGSLRRRALASKESESPRAVMHASGCTQHPGAYRRSARPSSGWERKEERNEDQKNNFVARMSEATCGAVSLRRGTPDYAIARRRRA